MRSNRAPSRRSPGGDELTEKDALNGVIEHRRVGLQHGPPARAGSRTTPSDAAPPRAASFLDRYRPAALGSRTDDRSHREPSCCFSAPPSGLTRGPDAFPPRTPAARTKGCGAGRERECRLVAPRQSALSNGRSPVRAGPGRRCLPGAPAGVAHAEREESAQVRTRAGCIRLDSRLAAKLRCQIRPASTRASGRHAESPKVGVRGEGYENAPGHCSERKNAYSRFALRCVRWWTRRSATHDARHPGSNGGTAAGHVTRAHTGSARTGSTTFAPICTAPRSCSSALSGGRTADIPDYRGSGRDQRG